MTMLGHRKYKYLFCRENQGKIICPRESPLDFVGALERSVASVQFQCGGQSIRAINRSESCLLDIAGVTLGATERQVPKESEETGILLLETENN